MPGEPESPGTKTTLLVELWYRTSATSKPKGLLPVQWYASAKLFVGFRLGPPMIQAWVLWQDQGEGMTCAEHAYYPAATRL